MRQYRNEERNIVYIDESWINVGHTLSKVWKDKTVKTPKDAFLAGLSTGLKGPTARGPRFVLLHAGGKMGFIEGAKHVFLAKKNSGDYHDEMDSARFERWFKEQLWMADGEFWRRCTCRISFSTRYLPLEGHCPSRNKLSDKSPDKLWWRSACVCVRRDDKRRNREEKWRMVRGSIV